MFARKQNRSWGILEASGLAGGCENCQFCFTGRAISIRLASIMFEQAFRNVDALGCPVSISQTFRDFQKPNENTYEKEP